MNPLSIETYSFLIDGHATYPDIIYEEFKHKVDVVICGGYGGLTPSTVIDYTGNFRMCSERVMQQLQDE